MNLNSMTVEQLKTLCRERGIAGYSTHLRDGGKAALVAFVEQALDVVVESVEGPVVSEAGGVQVPVVSEAGGVEFFLVDKVSGDAKALPKSISNVLAEFFTSVEVLPKKITSVDGEPVSSEAGGVEEPVSSIDASQCLKIGGKVKIRCNDPLINGQEGVLLSVGDRGIARVQLNDGEYISSVASLTSVTDGDDDIKHLVNKLNTGEATKENLLNTLNALLVEIHLAAHKISPGIGENAVIASATVLLDFLRNDREKIDFAARYATALNTNNDAIEEFLKIKNYLEANFIPAKCYFKKGQLPTFEFEKIGGIEYIEDALDPLETHLIILAKCQSLWFCGYTHLINQKSFWTNGDELSVSLKFAQLKILTKGETVREAFEKR